MSKAFLLWGGAVFLLQLAPSARALCQNCIKRELVVSAPLVLHTEEGLPLVGAHRQRDNKQSSVGQVQNERVGAQISTQHDQGN